MNMFKKGHKTNLGRKRKPFSEDWKKKISESKRGKLTTFKNPEERSRKISQSLTGRKRPEISGENHYLWKGGISSTKEYDHHMRRLRRARLRDAPGTFSLNDWELLKESFNYTCVRCKKTEPEIKLTVDHIVALSRGGSNHLDNIQPLCQRCNAQKRNTLSEYADKFNTLIVGAGEIGTAIYNTLKDHYRTSIIDRGIVCDEPITYLHICFGFSEDFVKSVREYQDAYKPIYTIVHSTVPLGTCRQLGAIHSPVTGIHPHLESGIRTFVKFLGGENASEVADYFRRAGMKVYLCDKSETTELMKLSQTTFYALMVEYVKDLKKQCLKHDVPFSEAYTLASQNYNEGYEKLGYPEFKMPLLVPIQTPQGGHCTIPNCDLWQTDFTKFIKLKNAGAK